VQALEWEAAGLLDVHRLTEHWSRRSRSATKVLVMTSRVPELISGREAARRLESAGVGRRRTRSLLDCGLAGAATEAAGAKLYDARRVDALCSWPTVSLYELHDVLPRGTFFARRYVDLLLPRAEQDRAWSTEWPLSPLTAVWLKIQIERTGSVPFVGSVCGFITHGADLCRVEHQTAREYELSLIPAGAWFHAVRQHRLAAPGGSRWMVLGCPA